jgi:hypothetical protein
MVDSYKEYGIMAIFEATSDASDTQCEKRDICQGVDNLSNIDGNVVILYNGLAIYRDSSALRTDRMRTYFFAPIYG